MHPVSFFKESVVLDQGKEKKISPGSIIKITPMMEQYIKIKAANADSLLFYHMGDFYELFFDDAIEASKVLNIALTKRGKYLGQDIPMCGVPVSTADEYLRKLISLGYKVAVCEQLEDPKEAKKRGSKSVVHRDVTRLVTPGTLTEEKLLDPTKFNFLMVLGYSSVDFSLAWIDISTGQFTVGQTSQKRLVADISRISPSEIVVSDTLFHEPQLHKELINFSDIITLQPDIIFDSAFAEKRVSEYFKLSTLSGLGQFQPSELSAISGIVAYIEKTQLAQRPLLMRPKREQKNSVLFLDSATRANLELMQTLSGKRDGSLLKAINRTITSSGSRLLAERLTSPLMNLTQIHQRHDSIDFFLQNPHLINTIREPLKSVPDISRALARLSVGRGEPRDLDVLKRGMYVAFSFVKLFTLTFLPTELQNACNALKNLPQDSMAELERALNDELPAFKRDGGFIRPGYNTQLDEYRDLLNHSRRIIAQLQSQYLTETGIKSLKVKHNNVLGYFVEITSGNLSAMTAYNDQHQRFVHRQTIASAVRFTTTELADLDTKIIKAADQALEIELTLFSKLAQDAISKAEIIRQGSQALDIIDVSAALALLAQEQDYCRPIVDSSLAFNIKAARHPVVEQALQKQSGSKFIKNDCNLSPDHGMKDKYGKIWLLTGPNMGGKSTFLRQNALIAILAQMGSFIPAQSAHIGIIDQIFSRVGASDDLAQGRSTFMVEMIETATILNQAKKRSLVILDEIGRGTATFDGLSIAWATVEYLHEVNQCRALFATHFHETIALAKKFLRLECMSMRVKEWKNDVIFLHEVGPGSADRSYGIQVARLAGIPEAVIKRAHDVLQQLENGKLHKRTQMIIDDLPLFRQGNNRTDTNNANDSKSKDNESGSNAVVQTLLNLNLDELSPKQAQDELYRLREKALNER